MAKQKAAAVSDEVGVLLQLDPAVIMPGDNARFGLKPSRIDSLAKSVAERGGVIEPVEVEPVEGQNGYKYVLISGNYRKAAVEQLNAQGAGLTLPAIVRVMASPTERLRRQLAENMERENQSPMDQAIAIKKLLDSGLNKMEVREIFSRPGGRKGTKVQPASNSFINMTLSFLDLPKAIQTKIHEGSVGVAAAYELTKVPAEKRAEVLEKAEAERAKMLEKEEKEEERILAQEKKLGEEQAKRDSHVKAVQEAEAQHQECVKALETATEVSTAAHAKYIGKHESVSAKKEANKAFKDAEAVRVKAEEKEAAARKILENFQVKLTKYETSASEKAAKLKAARAAAPQGNAKQKEAVGPADVKKASKATGTTNQAVPLTLKEIRDSVNELTAAGGHPKVIEIGMVIRYFFAGELTEKEYYKALVKIVS